ncbi:hypothetical protein SAMN05880582_104213 [Rhizobium sp. RU20A]|uniref:hypothetical protein n=1 Tax=Rhizobium sp. RU20A TaxID=1907412 RepID=UPI00095412AA|nr:hypothetical protein [Rhizobium sp. RU20A]SIQ89686.1 hypothetical protein SAMN05880582_104213 [Rhizobium sp. RU20A]
MKKPDDIKRDGAGVGVDEQIEALMGKIKHEDVPERLLNLARQLQAALKDRRPS